MSKTEFDVQPFGKSLHVCTLSRRFFYWAAQIGSVLLDRPGTNITNKNEQMKGVDAHRCCEAVTKGSDEKKIRSFVRQPTRISKQKIQPTHPIPHQLSTQSIWQNQLYPFEFLTINYKVKNKYV